MELAGGFIRDHLLVVMPAVQYFVQDSFFWICHIILPNWWPYISTIFLSSEILPIVTLFCRLFHRPEHNERRDSKSLYMRETTQQENRVGKPAVFRDGHSTMVFHRV